MTLNAAGEAVREESVPAWRPTRDIVAVLAVAYWAYMINGVVNSEIGPALPGLSHSFGVDVAGAGLIFTAQFAGYLVGALASGVAADRWGYRRVMAPGALLTALGTAGIVMVGDWPAAVALTAVAGCGFAITDTLSNAVVAAVAPRAGGTALNLLHTFFGVGALAGPLLVGAVLDSPGGWHVAFLVSGTLALTVTLALMLAPIPPPAHLATPVADLEEPVIEPRGVTSPSPWHGVWLWILVGLLCLFVGVEQLTGGWTTTYLHRVIAAPLDLAARSTSFYWAAVTLGRLLASAAALRLTNERLLGGSIALAGISMVALTLAGNVPWAILALCAVGFFFAPIYPLIVAIIARIYPHRFATLAGLLVAGGGLGGALFPWLAGALGQGTRTTFWVGVVILALMLVLFGASQYRPWGPTGEQA